MRRFTRDAMWWCVLVSSYVTAAPLLAQVERDRLCIAAVAGLLDASPSAVRVEEARETTAGPLLRWRTWRGDRGTCRLDDYGRAWEVAVLQFAGSAGQPGSAGGGAELLVCASEGNRRRECPLARGAVVRLVEQDSRAACIAEETWGVGDGYLWVDRGCRATFEVRRPQPFAPYTITCGSSGGRRSSCDIKLGAVVVLAEQISSAPCIRGETWGYGDGTLWVDRGCRGRFDVRQAGGWSGDRGGSRGVSPSGAPPSGGSGLGDRDLPLGARARSACQQTAREQGFEVGETLAESELGGDRYQVVLAVERGGGAERLTCGYDGRTGSVELVSP